VPASITSRRHRPASAQADFPFRTCLSLNGNVSWTSRSGLLAFIGMFPYLAGAVLYTGTLPWNSGAPVEQRSNRGPSVHC
jgi:hypothetical protein